MSKFKIGDRVKLTYKIANDYGLVFNQCYHVYLLSSGGYIQFKESYNPVAKKYFQWPDDYFELSEDLNEIIASGDKVRLFSYLKGSLHAKT